jgi:hypothetical protein
MLLQMSLWVRLQCSQFINKIVHDITGLGGSLSGGIRPCVQFDGDEWRCLWFEPWCDTTQSFSLLALLLIFTSGQICLSSSGMGGFRCSPRCPDGENMTFECERIDKLDRVSLEW